jgi:hypothetical protein
VSEIHLLSSISLITQVAFTKSLSVNETAAPTHKGSIALALQDFKPNKATLLLL